ncbi:MAG: GYD domain-containing protein [Candidatus Lokiarchaeota archaeon]|nr:GYD domain-containing protein [Candidatus Lokiarchaeota archaeon]
MPLYIILGKYTKEGITKIKDSPIRYDAAKKIATSVGGEIKNLYYTMGQYDFLSAIEAPNNEAMMQILLAIGSGGAVSTETLVAIPAEKGAEIIRKLP